MTYPRSGRRPGHAFLRQQHSCPFPEVRPAPSEEGLRGGPGGGGPTGGGRRVGGRGRGPSANTLPRPGRGEPLRHGIRNVSPTQYADRPAARHWPAPQRRRGHLVLGTSERHRRPAPARLLSELISPVAADQLWRRRPPMALHLCEPPPRRSSFAVRAPIAPHAAFASSEPVRGFLFPCASGGPAWQ